MGWQSGRARLTPEEAKAQLLAIVDEHRSTTLVGRNPWRALAIAAAAGFLIAKTSRLWSAAGAGGFWLLRQALPLPMLKPPDTALERLKARARRRG